MYTPKHNPHNPNLQEHPEGLSPSWNRITVEHIGNKHLEHEALITIEGGTKSLKEGYDIAFATQLPENKIKQIAKVLVHEFSDNPQWYESRLESIKVKSAGEFHTTWHVKIIEPYLD